MPIKRSYAEHGDACAGAHAMELLGDRWSYPIVRELMFGPKRFVELETGARGITPAVLTARLRELEATGLIRRLTLPAPARATAYELTDWGRELRPLLEGVARWALRSPVRDVTGCGLTPDAVAQSMLTMASPGPLAPPVVLALRLRDEREPSAERYDFRLSWDEDLTITREPAPDAHAVVLGDSTTWMQILFEGRPLADVEITGDLDAVRRVLARFPRI